ncbi:DUF1761 domain-containing protein [Flavobacterium johnsoniae]|jgi:hypothetical protein|uniref:DUF1761 domain-containing protein n=1 Tax=Flavobacterium johnsoniae TaxID=986 RepID=A0A1J7BTK8_FLAJO|nr:DUF1761 domain-containing protein [Flavobacterium johnsoniae]OIV42047.1 hypothetical protein BKM63_10365 [Flavobacterium johnsoniae]
MEFNFYALLAAAVVTLLVGFAWYHPKVFGTIWMRENNFTEDDLKKGSMLKIFGLTYIFSLMITMTLMGLTIHQSGAVGMVGGPPLIASAKPSFAAFMADYGTAYRTFKHGALHGFISGLFFALPIVGINGLFERKSWKYIFIHAGYWIVTLTLMGGIICAYA